jgi:hypothetical protein
MASGVARRACSDFHRIAKRRAIGCGGEDLQASRTHSTNSLDFGYQAGKLVSTIETEGSAKALKRPFAGAGLSISSVGGTSKP